MNSNHNCTQLETIYNQRTDIALMKQYMTTLDKEFARIRSWQITITILMITCLTGIIGILLEAYLNK